MPNQQLHKRLKLEQVMQILEDYLSGEIKSKQAYSALGIGKTRFFGLARHYKENPDSFDIRYKRTKSNNKIDGKVEKIILKELKIEKEIIENKNNSVSNYNFSHVKNSIESRYNTSVSVTTIKNRAKEYGFYFKKARQKKKHNRQVKTNYAGELVQHDMSPHQWSPYIKKRLPLISSIDDYSRKILFMDIFDRETSWKHIQAIESVVLRYGCPLKYYVDQHSIFRFVKNRDSVSRFKQYKKYTDDVDTQWKQVLNDLGVGAIYALSPQAKGKVERPFQWIQDRMVRTAAREKITTIQGLRQTLRDLVDMYNNKWIHSTTKEIPSIRFERAIAQGKNMFRTVELPENCRCTKDIFCLREKRVVDGYREISLWKNKIKMPEDLLAGDIIDVKIVPDDHKNTAELRLWHKNRFLGRHFFQKTQLDKSTFNF